MDITKKIYSFHFLSRLGSVASVFLPASHPYLILSLFSSAQVSLLFFIICSPHSFSHSFMCLFSSFHLTFLSVFALLKFSFQTKSPILFSSAELLRAGRCSHCNSARTILLLGSISQQNIICSYERRLLWSCFIPAASVCVSFHQLLRHPVFWMQSYSKAVFFCKDF